MWFSLPTRHVIKHQIGGSCRCGTKAEKKSMGSGLPKELRGQILKKQKSKQSVFNKI